MKWIWWESKSKTANKPLYWTSFDEVTFYMPTWNCTKIKRVRRIVNTAWVVIKFWSLRRWNWKTQLMMMEVDEVKTIFTHTSPSYLYWRSQGGRTWQPFVGGKKGQEISAKCVFTIFAANASFLRLIVNLQILLSKICIIYHVIVYFLPKKHCFCPKRALFCPKMSKKYVNHDKS